VRQFVSKSIAGGLSAGVVLLWWPLLFPDDTLVSWLVRGIAWTVCAELLVLALGPFEAAVWETQGGERLMRRARVAEARLRSGSRRRTLTRLAVIAVAALAIPGALLAAVPAERPPAKAVTRKVKVVQVTRVERPVTVTRVKRIMVPAPVAAPTAPVPSMPAASSPVVSRQVAAPAVDPPAAKPERTRPKRAPSQLKAPESQSETPAPAPNEPADCTACPKPPPAANGSHA